MHTSIAKDSAKLTLSRFITSLISMVTAMLLARFRTLAEYGTYSQILIVINLANSLFMLGLPNSINYFLAKAEDRDERSKFLSVYYTLSTLLSIITAVTLLVSIPIISNYFKNPLIIGFFYVFAIYPWTQIVMSSIDNILIIYHKTTLLMKYRIIHSVFLLVLIVILRVMNGSFTTYMIGLMIGEAAFTVYVYYIVRRLENNFRFLIDKSFIYQIFKFSVPIGLASVVGTLHIEFDKLFIGNYFNTEQLAIYTNASKEMPVLIISGSISAVLLPHMVKLFKEGRKKEGIDLWGDSVVLSYIIIGFLATGLFVYASDAIILLYSDKYVAGVKVFQIYCIALSLKSAYFATVLNSVGKTKLIFYSSIAALGMNIVLNFICYLFLGFEGPAIATLITTIAVALFQLAASAKAINIPFRDIFPWGRLLQVTVINIALGIMFYFLKIVLPIEATIGNIAETLLLSCIWGVIYLLIVYKNVIKIWKKLN